MRQQRQKLLLEENTMRIIKIETLSNSLNKYTQFALEATMEDYLLGPTSKS